MNGWGGGRGGGGVKVEQLMTWNFIEEFSPSPQATHRVLTEEK